MPENANNGAGAGAATETIDQIHDAHLSAFEAWQAAPDKPELKEAATAATAKWKAAFAADKKAREEAASKSKPPEKYDLKLPDGSRLDPKHVEDVAAFAKSNGLSQDVAKAILERENTNFAAYVDGEMKKVQDEQANWIKAIETDKEIGGPNAAKNMELVKRVVSNFGPEGLTKELDDSGLGNHPGFNKLLVRIIKAGNFAEDTLVVGDPAGKSEIPPEKAMFPNMAAQLGRK